MKPRSLSKISQLDLFQAQSNQLLNPHHSPDVLAKKVNRNPFGTTFVDCYFPDVGSSGKAIRLLFGPHYLEHAFSESDESLLNRRVKNPYWQYLCGS